MQIEVIKKYKDNPPKVLCRSKYGQFFAYWSEDDVNENEWYDVELDTDEELIDGVNLFKVEEKNCIYSVGEKLKIVGTLESIDNDGYMIVRVDNSALTFVTSSSGFEPGLVVKILLNQIKAYPIEY